MLFVMLSSIEVLLAVPEFPVSGPYSFLSIHLLSLYGRQVSLKCMDSVEGDLLGNSGNGNTGS